MPQIAQHEAAELWELCRDHAVAASKLQMAAQMCQDPQLRQTVQRHAQEFQQAAQRLYQLLQQPGQSPYAGTWQTAPGATWQVNPGQAMGQASAYAAGYGPGSYGAGVQPVDVMVAGDCLRMCKTFAVQCVWGATEAAHPAREVLYQLAGEHLRMADEHYRWLEQRGVYASPKADQTTIQQYSGKLQQLMAMSQGATPYAHAAVAQVSPAYGHPGAQGFGGQAHGGYGAYGGYGGQETGHAAHAGGYYGGYAEQQGYGGYRAYAQREGEELSARRDDAETY